MRRTISSLNCRTGNLDLSNFCCAIDSKMSALSSGACCLKRNLVVSTELDSISLGEAKVFSTASSKGEVQ